MTAFYNEIDPYAAQWLRNLIDAGHIAPGIVDERDIRDILPSELAGFTQCHFFAGIGVWSYALRLAGWPDDRPVWTGSCPCQPFSAAGKGAGFDDERHLWPAWHHLIRTNRPSTVFGEQVASIDGLAWLDLVQDDLAGTDYTSTAVDLCAAGVGAPHIRQRLWFVAHADGRNTSTEREQRSREHRQQPQDSGVGFLGNANAQRYERAGACGARGLESSDSGFWSYAEWLECRDGKSRPIEPGTFPLAHGVANRVGRLRAYGNAINAEAARVFIESCMT